MKLIVGLGNPGLKYKWTRHNFGSLIVEAIAKKLKVKFKHSMFVRAKVASIRQLDKKIFLLLPMTFMNLSGGSIVHAVRRNRLHVKDILVVCDDINLDFGRIRFRASGSDGGHNGLKSVIACLGTKDFSRLRIGIGPAEEKDISDFVLSEFNKEQKQQLSSIIDKAVEASLCWVELGIAEAMNKYN